jgi:hypothetical protein
VTREEFSKLVEEAMPSVETDDVFAFRGSIHRCDWRPDWQVGFGTQFWPFVAEYIPENKFPELSEAEAKEIIQRTLDRLITLRKEVKEFINERLNK